MEKINMKFGNTEIEKQEFHQYKRPISIKNKGINKIVVPNKVLNKGFKYFISRKNAEKCENI